MRKLGFKRRGVFARKLRPIANRPLPRAGRRSLRSSTDRTVRGSTRKNAARARNNQIDRW